MKKALSVDEELAHASAKFTKYRWSLLKRYNNLGPLLCDSQRPDEAGEAHDKAIAVGKKLVANEPMIANYAIVLGGAFCNSGNLSFRQGDVETAVDAYASAIATLEPIRDRDNRSGNARRFLANSHAARARALGELKQHAEAVARQEGVRRWGHADRVLDDLTWFNQFGLVDPVTIPSSYHPERNLARQSVGRNVD